MAEIVVKESKENLEQKEEKRSWSQLPQDLLSLVSSHLFAIDPGAIGTTRLTCKTWGLMDSIFPLPPPPFDLSPHNYPYLMSLKDHTCKFFHPIYDHTFQMNIPELSDAIIHYSKQGWLLLCRKDGDVLFFNPFTTEKITLPKLDPRHDITTMCFSSLPTCSNCYVFGVSWPGLEISVIKLGETQWTLHSISSHLYSEKFNMSYCHPVMYKKRCYFLGENSIRVFDLNDNKFSIHGLSLTQSQLHSLYRSFLVESNGELLIVFVTQGEQRIFVKGINISKKIVCRPIQKLSNKMLYISYGGSFSVPAMERAIGNKIYFPKILNNSCIFYSLTTRKYHSFYGDYSSGIPRDVKEFTNCAWIERNYY